MKRASCQLKWAKCIIKQLVTCGSGLWLIVLQNLKVPLCQVLKGIVLTAHAAIAEFGGHIPAALLSVEVKR